MMKSIVGFIIFGIVVSQRFFNLSEFGDFPSFPRQFNNDQEELKELAGQDENNSVTNASIPEPQDDNLSPSNETAEEDSDDTPQVQAMPAQTFAQDYCNYKRLSCQWWDQENRFFKSSRGRSCYSRTACKGEGSSSYTQCRNYCL